MKYSPTIVFIALFALLSVTHAATYNIVVDDFAGLNLGDANNLDINYNTIDGLNLKMGPGTSSLGRDAFGVGTSTFAQTGAWFDGSYAKFGNSGNQQLLDFRITNNLGTDAKLTNISFDIRKEPGNANPTSYNLLYLASGDSALVKGSSVSEGSEMFNLSGLGTGTIDGGINEYSNVIGSNISGTGWIADGGYANIRLKINTGNAAAGSQLDNFSVTMQTVSAVPEPSSYAFLLGLVTLLLVSQRRHNQIN